MSDKIKIFVKQCCPYCAKARLAFEDKAEYIDVSANKSNLEEMLRYSKGRKEVPVIVDGNKVTIGYGGS
jgi:glutaredoxin 3